MKNFVTISLVSALVLLLGALFTPATQAGYMDVVLADNPIGYWRVGETGSTTALDSTTPAENGTALAGVALGGTAGALVGDANKAATFSGSYLDGHINVGNHFDFTASDPHTIEAWVKTTETGKVMQTIAGKFDQPNSGGYFLAIHNDLGLLYQAQDLTNGGGLYTCGGSPSGLADGAWHYVVATKAAGASYTDVSLYIDGSLVASPGGTDWTTLTTMANTYPFRIGTRDALAPPATNNAFVGSLDEVALYDSVLSGSAIGDHYAAGIPEPSTLVLLATGLLGLLAYGLRKRK